MFKKKQNKNAEMKEIFRDYDIIARMGGDEFLVFMKDFKSIAILEQKAHKLCTALSKKEIILNTDIHISVSVGISIYTTKDAHSDGFTTLYKKADEALYIAKEKGKNQFVIYNDSIL